MASSVLSPVKRKIDYPSSDGKPVAESDVHISCLLHTREDLKLYFGNRPDVYVAGNLLIYYEENNVKARVAPDVFVVMGVASHDRTSYLLWEEGKAPDFVLEITSRGTRKEDQGKKRELYRRLRVTEYWQYDPKGEWLAPPLRGTELVAGEYRELPARELADGTLAMMSTVLGLELRSGASGLRFHDPVMGRHIPTRTETVAGWERAERLLEQEKQARERAETAPRAGGTGAAGGGSARGRAGGVVGGAARSRFLNVTRRSGRLRGSTGRAVAGVQFLPARGADHRRCAVRPVAMNLCARDTVALCIADASMPRTPDIPRRCIPGHESLRPKSV